MSKRKKTTGSSRAEQDREIDEGALRGGKTEWMGSQDPAAGDPVTDEERIGASLLGPSSVRGGAIQGVSDPSRGGNAGPDELPDAFEERTGSGERRNPPELDDAGS